MASITPILKEVPPPAQVGNWVRKARKAYKMSQSQLAKRIGSTQQVIAHIESGQANPRMSTIVALADAFQVRVDIKFVRKR